MLLFGGILGKSEDSAVVSSTAFVYQTNEREILNITAYGSSSSNVGGSVCSYMALRAFFTGTGNLTVWDGITHYTTTTAYEILSKSCNIWVGPNQYLDLAWLWGNATIRWSVSGVIYHIPHDAPKFTETP